MTLRIIYVGKHSSGGNEDEQAIAYCLRKMGYEVVCLEEHEGKRAIRSRGDVLLFHKWDDTGTLMRLHDKIFRVFWYFDLVDHPDLTIKARCDARKAWMRRIVPNVELGFCTDGDWVERVNNGEVTGDKTSDGVYTTIKGSRRLIRLTQGADGRKVGYRDPDASLPPSKLLFTGTQRGGIERESFVREMKAKFGPEFVHVQAGLHGEDLAKAISRTSIVVAPDSPVSDQYWSNRVYLTLGFGGFLLHPYCKTLLDQYIDGEDLVMYESRIELVQMIEHYLPRVHQRRKIASSGLLRTKEHHTYMHRCEEMMGIIKERMAAL